MKKIYTLLSVLLVGSCAVAQTVENTTERPTNKKYALERATSNVSQVNYAGSREDIYTEDFANSIPNDWTAFTESGPCDWIWTNEGHMGDFPSASLNSTTADNGWMIIDSDLCGAEGGDIEVAYLTSPSIDCSANTSVAVRFEQYFRRYAPAAEVTSLEVSTDGGTTWNSYEFNADVDQTGTPNPDVVQVNITDIAAGQSDVQFRFRWEGTWGYGWQIDDFAVFEPLDNDVTLSNTGYQELWDPAVELDYRDLAYSVYPQSQLRDMTLRGSITNNGGMVQTNVFLQADISGPDGYSVSLMSDPVDIDPAQTSYFTIENYTPPAVNGEYMITFTAIQDAEDENDVDNTGSANFWVSDAEYARDRGVAQGEFTNYDDAYKLGTTYFMEVDEELHCIGVALSNTSTENATFNMELIDGSSLDYMAESALAFVPSADNLNDVGDSNWTWVPMENAIPLSAGTDYGVVLNAFAGTDIVNIRLSGTSPAQTSFFFEGSEDTWYYVTSTPMVRMGLSEEFCTITGIDAPEQVAAHNLFPNPTTGQSTLEYTLLEAANVQIMVFDNHGRVVFQENKGMQPVDEYRFDYDFSGLAKGFYTMSIMVGDNAVNQKLVIQ